MNKSLKIVFFGTPDFAVHILQAILEQKFEVSAVVSAPDKSAGRGRKIHTPAVAKFAKAHNLALLQPEKLKSKEFLKALEEFQADVFVVVAFRKLPRAVWQMPKKGTFNLHASLLPDYRGAAPINWAIINGEKTTGVTTFFIDENIDTGQIILQKKCAISPDETAGELHDKLMELGAETTVETLQLMSKDGVNPAQQSKPKLNKDAPKLFKENTKIQWQGSLESIFNFVRGLNPYPTAWTYFKNENEKKYVKIIKVQIQHTPHSHKIGDLFIENAKLGVGHRNGIIWVEELQMEGKKQLKAQDFINGFGDLTTWRVD